MIINKQTEKEISKNASLFNSLEMKINTIIGEELAKNPSEPNLLKISKQTSKQIDKFKYSRVGVDELKKYSRLNLQRLKVNGIIDYQPTDYQSQLDNDVKKSLDKLPLIAITTATYLSNIYNNSIASFVPTEEMSKSMMEKIMVERAMLNLKTEFIKKDNYIYFVRKNGSHEHFRYWYDRNSRYIFTKEYDEQRKVDMANTGNDLSIISAHADSSPQCEPWQGRIVSEFGLTPNYPTLEEAEADGFRHLGCRHNVDPYVDGAEDIYRDILKIDKKEIDKNYKDRQDGKKYRRHQFQNEIKGEKAKALGDKELADKYFKKAEAFGNKADNLGVN